MVQDLKNILPSQLMQSILGKLYSVLTQGDDSVPASKDNFLSWCTPGIPINEEDLNFVSQGLTGVLKPTGDSATKELTPEEKESQTGVSKPTEVTATKELTASEKESLMAKDAVKLYTQAEAFARMVDFIPDINAGTNGQQLSKLNVQQNEGTLSDVYKYALQFSQVANTELAEEEKAKIAKFRELLQVKRKKKDLITDEEKEVIEPSPLVTLYNEKLQIYADAVLEYNKYRVDALSGTNQAAIHFWALNAATLRKKVQAALADWINNGYKNEFEGIAARIDQIMSKDLSLLKEEYKDTLERAKLTGIATGSDFYYTTLAPANFVKGGWTKFSFASSEFDYHSKGQATSYGANASSGFLGIGTRAGYQHSDSKSETTIDASDFSLTFEMCQVPIIRPWFKTPFLTSKAWKLDPGSPVVQSKENGEVLCDGKIPPNGIMPGYPTSIIFIRDLVMNFGAANGAVNSAMESNSFEGSVGWGPFTRVSGNYSNKKTQTDAKFSYSAQGIEVKGMQIIGFNCHVLPKSPNPLESIKNWI